MPPLEPVTTQMETMECKIMVLYLSQPTTGVLKTNDDSGHALLTRGEEPGTRDAGAAMPGRGGGLRESARVAMSRLAFAHQATASLMRGYFGRSQPSDKSRPCDPA